MMWPVAWPGFWLFVQVGVVISWPGLVCVVHLHTDAHPATRCTAMLSARRAWSESPGTRRGGAGVCAAGQGLRGAAGPCRRAAVSLGRPMRSMVRTSSSADSSRRVAEFLAAHFDTLAAAAEGCDALVTTGFTHFAARSVTDKRGTPYVYATFCPINLPSLHQPPSPRR